MNTPFTISPYSIEEMGTRGSGRVTVKVNGYWSSDPITLYVSRDWSYERDAPGSIRYQWNVTLGHSSGGRDTKEVADDLESAVNFGMAMIALASVGRMIRAQEPALEAAYQAAEAAREALRAEALAAAKAKAEADEALGKDRALLLTNAAIVKAQDTGLACIQAFERGISERYVEFTFERTRDRKVIAKQSGTRVRTVDVPALLATYSHRTTVLVMA